MLKRLMSVWLCILLCMTGLTVLCVFDIPISLVGKVSGGTVNVGSGPGNATASIQDAIDNFANSGDTIFVYAGTYPEKITVDKTINLTGEDRDSTIIIGDGGGNVVFIDTAWANITGFTITNGTFGCMISGSSSSNNNTIAGNNISNNTCGIYLNTASNNNTIAGNNISNNNDGIQLESASNNNITGNNVSWNDDDGISIGSSSNNIITSNYVSWNNDDGISLGSSSINNTVACNIILNNTYGIFLDFASNNSITGNNVSNNSYGIYMWSSLNNTFTGNNISSSSLDGIRIEGSSNNNILTGNNISNNDDGILVSSSSNNTITGNNISWHINYGIRLGTSSGYNTISGNNISSNSRVGISLSGSSDNTIAGNSISSNDRDGLYMWSSSNNIITGNNFTSNNWSGISLEESSNNTIEGNNISFHDDCGIYLWHSSNNTITDNNITNNTQGIFVYVSSNSTIVRNNTFSNSDNGIYLKTASHNTITGNNFTNNTDGIDVELYSINNSIAGNNISSNSDCGIELDSTSHNNTITGNNISNNTQGVYLSGSTNNTITCNYIYSNSDCGIFLNTASNNNTISGNNITNNLEGIYLDELFNNTITDNNIYSNRDCGIFFQTASHYNTISGNNITSNDFNGIFLVGASNNNTIAGNNISSNILNGIYLSDSSNNTITGNNLSSNIEHGIYLDSASNNTIIGNNVSSNDDGIYLSNVSYSTITGNNISDNYNGIYLQQSSNITINGNNITNTVNGINSNSASYNNYTGNYFTNNVDAIDFELSSNNNRITNNNIISNTDCGIEIDSSSNNIIIGNNNSNNNYAIYLTSSTNNSIYHNNFINNTNSAFDDAVDGNQWDNGYPSGGNYWSDYAGVDIFNGPLQNIPGSDWIGDENYTIDADSKDRYPLMLPTFLIPPIIRNVTANPDLQETGSWVNISCNVTDNIGVYNVWVNITIPGGGYITDFMNRGTGNRWFYNNTHTPVGLYPYTIWASDTDNNWNSSSGYSFTIQDTTFPVISNILNDPDTQETGGRVNITCDVTDNIGVGDVRVNITLPGGGYINDSMIKGPGDRWYHNETHTPLGSYLYTIWSNDTSNNWISSSGHSFMIQDTTLPVIVNVSALEGTQETGDWVNITCDVTDNIEVYDVRVNITLPNGGYINDSMIKGPGNLWYYNDTDVQLGMYPYIIWVNDTSNNWNFSSGHIFNIWDTELPEIINPTATPGTQESGGSVNITVDVTDDVGLVNVWVNITSPNGSSMNITMTQGSGDKWYLDAPYLEVGTYSYTIWTNDTSDNWNSSLGNTFAIVDTVAPEIQDVRATPDPQSAGSSVNITCNSTDVTGIFGVWVNITLPGGSSINVSMRQGPGDLWYDDTVYMDLGTYNCVVWTNDSFGNWNSSAGHNFTIKSGQGFNIILISGDGQSAAVGTQLTNPLVIEVQDSFGNVVSNAMVWFNVTVGEGSLDIASPVFTNPIGRAQIHLTLGTTSGTNSVTAGIVGGGITQVIFNATGEPGAPYDIMIVSGNNAQTGAIATELNDAFVVQVFDRFGNRVPDAEVWFNVTAGGGSLDTSSPVMADSQGRAQTYLTLGGAAGTNTVTAEISGGGTTQVIFTATGLSNEPVINKVVPNIELLEDDPPYTLDLSTYAIDDVDSSQDLMWFITDSDNSLYTVSGQGTDTLVITTKPNKYGSDMVTLWVMDSDGLQDSQPLWINITPINDRPFFFPKPPDLTITGDVPYTFDYEPYIHDVDNDIGALEITSSDSDHTFVVDYKVTYTYPASMIGQQVFVVLTLDDGLDDTSEVIQVNVSEDNVPFVTDELPDVTMYEDEIRLNVFDLDEYFDDPDGDALYFSYGYTHINIIINENHSVDFNAESNWFGEETVTFRAYDPDYAIAEDTITVIVLPRNDPPSISGVPDLVVRYNSTYYFDLTPYIFDTDNTGSELGLAFMEFSGGSWVESGDIQVSAGNNLKMAVNYSVDDLGMVFRVRIEVSDGIASATDEININVSEDWPPELIEEMPDVLLYEDEYLSDHFNVHNYFRDPDGDALFYTYGQVHVRIEIHNNGSVDFHSDPNWYGTENITIRATDPYGALAEDIITVSVLPVNDLPQLSQIPDQEGVSGETWIIDLGPYLSDVDNNITELEILCDSQYITVAGTVLIFQYPVDMTEDTVQIMVRDPGNASATAVFNTTLSKARITGRGEVDIVQYILTIILIIVILATILVLYAYQRGKYEVEELFLVYALSGNLISHHYHGEKEVKDRDLMASMFTAVQAFISDAFDPEHPTKVPLKVMEIGDKKIMIERGEYTYLAAVFKGGTWRLASKIRKAVAKIETEYSDKLEDWDGVMDDLEGIHEHLDGLMGSG